jgi:hypothetical protein
MARSPGTRTRKRRPTSNRKSRTVSARAKTRRSEDDLQARIFKVFAEQADSLWSDLTEQCRQFADAFNRELGANELQIEADDTMLRAAYPKGDAELFFRLDKGERYLQCWLNTGCAAYGSCATDQPPVGLTVTGGALHFALRGEIVSDEQLAIAMMTRLTTGDEGEHA